MAGFQYLRNLLPSIIVAVISGTILGIFLHQNVLSPLLISRSEFSFPLLDPVQADFRSELSRMHANLNSILDNIMAKQILLNETLEEIEALKKNLTTRIVYTEGPIPSHLITNDPNLNSLALEAARLSGAPLGSIHVVNHTKAVNKELLTRISETMPVCLGLMCQCEELQLNLSARRQTLAQANRESRLFEWLKGAVEELYRLEEWFAKTGKTWEDAEFEVKQRGGDEMLQKFYYHRVLYSKYLDMKAANPYERLENMTDDADAATLKAEVEMNKTRNSFNSCKHQLWEKCHWKLPRDSWRENHDLLLEEYRAKSNGTEGTCSERVGFEERGREGLAAPFELWQRDPELYPDRVNVTFVVEYHKKDSAYTQALVDVLWDCTHGILGDGHLPGVTSQLVVMLNHAVDMGIWLQKRHETESGEFLIPIFTHGQGGRLRAFNAGARVAKGYVVVFLEQSVVPPQNCSWVSDVLSVFREWPKLGALGLGSSSKGKRKFGRNSFRFAREMKFSAAAVSRKTFVDMGGFDENVSGADVDVADRQLSFRIWLSGHHVGRLHFRNCFQVHAADESDVSSKNNRIPFDLSEEYGKEVDREVARMNKLL